MIFPLCSSMLPRKQSRQFSGKTYVLQGESGETALPSGVSMLSYSDLLNLIFEVAPRRLSCKDCASSSELMCKKKIGVAGVGVGPVCGVDSRVQCILKGHGHTSSLWMST